MDSDENIWISSSDGDLEAVKRYLNSGVSVNAQDENGYSPLHAAASYDCFELAEFLLTNGADVNIRDADGDTPLLYSESPEMVQLLVKHGADFLAVNNQGEGLIHKAFEDENESLLSFILSNFIPQDDEERRKMIEAMINNLNTSGIKIEEENDEEDDMMEN